MRYTTSIFITCSILLLPGVCFAANAETPTSLVQLYRTALGNSPNISSYKSQVDAATARYNQSRANLLPQLSANASFSYGTSKTDYTGSANASNSNNTSDSRSANISLRQALFHKSDFHAVSQQTVLENLAKASLRSAEQQLMLEIADGYFSLLSARQNLLVATAQKNALAQHLERANVGFKLGVIGINDKLDAQARFDIAVSDELDAENKLLVSNKSLEMLSGISISANDIHALSDNSELPGIETRLEEWESLAQQNSIAVVLADYGREIEQTEISKVQGQRYPILDLVIKASEQSQYSSFARANSDTTGATASLELSVPLFTSGLLSARVAEARAKRDQKLAELENTKRTVLFNVRKEFLTASSLKKQHSALRSAHHSSQIALDAAQKGREVGTRTNLDILDAQQQLFDVERTLATTHYNYLSSQIRLKNITGVLTIDDLERLDKLLNPT